MTFGALAASCIWKHMLSNRVLRSEYKAFDALTGFARMSAFVKVVLLDDRSSFCGGGYMYSHGEFYRLTILVRVQSVSTVFVSGEEWDMTRLRDVGVAWLAPRRQVPPLFFSCRDQRNVVSDHLCGCSVK
eukprot:6242310-Pyramimonas_sp.AAC.1